MNNVKTLGIITDVVLCGVNLMHDLFYFLIKKLTKRNVLTLLTKTIGTNKGS